MEGDRAVRKYFPRLLGNDAAVRRIGRAIENDTLSHAFLIGGPSGSGKSVLALELAAAVNCEMRHADTPLPCGECSSCKRIYSGSFPDVKTVSKPSDRATLGVDPIKDMREDMFLSATEADTKVYIIDDAECMTPEAQNALLKVLEEPPGKILIILLARECDKILTTIKSRTQYIAMSRFSEDELLSLLPKMSPDAASLMREDADRLRSVIMSADGRLGEAIRLCDKRSSEECKAQRDEVMALLLALRQNGANADIYRAVTAMQTTKRPELIASLENVMAALRDLIAIEQSDTVKLLFFTARADAKALAHEIGLHRALRAYDAAVEAHGYCTKNAGIQNILTNMCARLALRD